jgi:hypothetical protein
MLGVYLYVGYLGVCFMQCLEYQVSCGRFEQYHCRYLVSFPCFVLIHAARGILFYTYKASLLSFSRYHESQVSRLHFLQYPGNQVSGVWFSSTWYSRCTCFVQYLEHHVHVIWHYLGKPVSRLFLCRIL